jgi:uncharacterized membrane protein HdeD (DUF308 family)
VNDPTDFIPLLIFSIPLLAIGGGIIAGIVRMVHRQRTWELIQRERIAAIERGIAPEAIAQMQPAAVYDEPGWNMSPGAAAQRLQMYLRIYGIVILFVGVGLCIFLNGVSGEANVWMVGLLPSAAGLGLLASSMVVRPPSEAPPSPPAR